MLPYGGLDVAFYQQDARLDGQLHCGIGVADGGTFAGTVKVIAASEAELKLEVAGTQGSALMNKDTDGVYTVPICPGTSLKYDSKALAMKYWQLPGNNSGNANVSCTGGGGPFTDPETLLLYISNLDQSCLDPYHSMLGCVGPRYQVAIELPVNLQKIGSIPLQGLTSLMTSKPGSSYGGACTSGGGVPYWDGTLDITAIDATGVTFTLSGTADTGLALGNIDGTYNAPNCF